MKKVLIIVLLTITLALTACQPLNWLIQDVLGIDRKEDLGPQRELSASIIGDEGGSVAPLFATGTDGETVNFFVNKKVGYDYDSVFVNGVGHPFTIAVGNVFSIIIEGIDYDIRFKMKKNNQGLLMGTWKIISSFERGVGTIEWQKVPNSIYRDTYIFTQKKYSLLDSSGYEIGNGSYSLNLETDSLIIGANPQGADGSRYKMSIVSGEKGEQQLELIRLDKYYTGTVRVPSKDQEKLFVFEKKKK